MKRISVVPPRSLRAGSPGTRRGAAMVEFALIAPVFLTLMLGVLEIGMALDISNTMTSAVREGGRLACMDWSESLPPGTTINQKVTADIRNFLVAAGLPGDKVTISITSAEGNDSGQNFDLGNPANKGRLFKIKATMSYKDGTSIPASFMKNRSIEPSLVFRAGRSNLTY